MNLELDHVFILVEPEAKVADLLVQQGFLEGGGRPHPGQGTTNRRFFFANGMLEFLWVADAAEARKGPGKNLRFPDRAQAPHASPFGVILRRQNPAIPLSPNLLFPGWHYQPAYFEPPTGFHVGANAYILAEPLCFYASFIGSGAARPKPEGNPQSIRQVHIHTPSPDLEGVLKPVSQADGLSIIQGKQHLMEMTLEGGASGGTSESTYDFRPEIPLLIHTFP